MPLRSKDFPQKVLVWGAFCTGLILINYPAFPIVFSMIRQFTIDARKPYFTANVSDFPTPYLTHVDIVEAGLLSIDSDVLSAASTVESARFMNNRITHIDADAFRFVSVIFALVSDYINFYFPINSSYFRVHFSSSLKSLDLSYNSLTEVPLAALARLSALDWLNLHR